MISLFVNPEGHFPLNHLDDIKTTNANPMISFCVIPEGLAGRTRTSARPIPLHRMDSVDAVVYGGYTLRRTGSNYECKYVSRGLHCTFIFILQFFSLLYKY